MRFARHLGRILSVSVATAVGATLAQGRVSWRSALTQAADWYRSSEAASLADSVVAYQCGSGGWPKNADFSKPPSDEYRARREIDRAATIDNGATTTPLLFLARVIQEQPNPGYIAAVNRGLDYLLEAQYENGGWPQFFPLRSGYYEHITYNDGAMINVMNVLRDVATCDGTLFDFVDAHRQRRALAAVEKGIECILRTQIRENGRLAGWCAQHDVATFAPAAARNFEPVSLSGCETVGIVRFLMGIEQPSDEVRASIENAVQWLESVAIDGMSLDEFRGADGERDRRVVKNPKARKLWARFYELGTHRPIFAGRDKVVHYDYNAIERERRVNYSYLGTWPAKLLNDEYPRWLAKHSPATSATSGAAK